MKKIKTLFITVLLIIVLPILFVSSVILIDSILHPNEVPSFFGWKPFMILTSSMEDTIMAGDVVVVKEVNPKTLEKGTIIAFQCEDKTIVTNRIIDIQKNTEGMYFLTKGDNNSTSDDWKISEDQIEGVYQFKIDGLGNIAMFLQSTTGMLICMTIPIALLFIIQLVEDLKDRKKSKQAEKKLRE